MAEKVGGAWLGRGDLDPGIPEERRGRPRCAQQPPAGRRGLTGFWRWRSAGWCCTWPGASSGSGAIRPAHSGARAPQKRLRREAQSDCGPRAPGAQSPEVALPALIAGLADPESRNSAAAAEALVTVIQGITISSSEPGEAPRRRAGLDRHPPRSAAHGSAPGVAGYLEPRDHLAGPAGDHRRGCDRHGARRDGRRPRRRGPAGGRRADLACSTIHSPTTRSRACSRRWRTSRRRSAWRPPWASASCPVEEADPAVPVAGAIAGGGPPGGPSGLHRRAGSSSGPRSTRGTWRRT